MVSKTEEIASTLLGKKVSGSEYYDPSLLVAVPRFENREQYNIDENNLPFEGYDIWHAYEISFLTKKGVPVNGVAKIKYNCNSKYIVESKSLKLYLNSFNMTPMKDTVEESLKFFLETVRKDLSEKLETNVEVEFHDKLTSSEQLYTEYTPLQELCNIDEIECTEFNENPDLLHVIKDKSSEISIIFNGLKSNCRITRQPDFADIAIKWKSKHTISYEDLLKYIVSFRHENHFHCEIIECMYKRLWDKLEPEELSVTGLYTRRGGISIYPMRTNKIELLNQTMLDPTKYVKGTIRD